MQQKSKAARDGVHPLREKKATGERDDDEEEDERLSDGSQMCAKDTMHGDLSPENGPDNQASETAAYDVDGDGEWRKTNQTERRGCGVLDRVQGKGVAEQRQKRAREGQSRG
ncbi:hypothetical protein SPI_07846 [Niveomyces insectorum RCEF 264]|uniref:Uncharacterized protein n=1 Tax=Niveomyces insectorum RCEF 264 TaxID=1081102 RepID=A0A162IF50_9HYPO|nr:hypothetical protein SPI_07846 [Niveomyces insectorum RCEF 264]